MEFSKCEFFFEPGMKCSSENDSCVGNGLLGNSQIWFFVIFTRKRSLALFCALLRSFALFCVCALLRSFLRPTAFRTTAENSSLTLREDRSVGISGDIPANFSP